MPIDWLTVAAQAINFIVLVLLLRHFLYRPIVRAMDRRQERVADRLHAAEQEREAAEDERRRLAEERAELEDRRDEVLREARAQAEDDRRRTLREAREEARRRERSWARELERRGEQVARDVVETMGAHVAEAMRRGFDELAGADLRAAATDRFLERLAALEGEERERLAEAMRGADVEVRVAAEPSDEEREELVAALEGLGAEAGRISFRDDAGLIAGVEARAGGRRVAWSLRRYVDELERAMHGVMDEAARATDPPPEEGRDAGSAGDAAGSTETPDEAEDAERGAGAASGDDHDRDGAGDRDHDGDGRGGRHGRRSAPGDAGRREEASHAS